jgi:glycosyltransferase involved in cell wall biosynthesis
MGDAVDVALLSPGTTLGWRIADAAFASLVREAGATCAVVGVSIGRAGVLRRHAAVTDLVEALAARHSARRLPETRAVVVSTVTASFFQDLQVPYAIRFDAPAALNRPGPAGAWQRAIEPRALARARLLLPWSEEAAAPLGVEGPEVIALAVPIEPIEAATERDIDALAYVNNVRKRGLATLCAAWGRAGSPGRLVIAGVEAARSREWLARCGVAEPAGVEWAGLVARPRWLEMLGRARLFVNASRFEDHGLAPLEALAAGAVLVSVPAAGPYPALGMARALAPALVTAGRSPAELAEAIRSGLALSETQRRDYAQGAGELLIPHRAAAISATMTERVLPALGVTPG